MRPSLRPAAFAALILLGAGALARPAFADTPTPGTPPASMPSATRTPRPLPPPAAAGARMPVLTGQVQRWLVNPNGEVDGLLLADGTQVAFPPHLSAGAQQLLKPGDGVHVTGWRMPDAMVVRASSLTATASGRSLSDTPPATGAGAGTGASAPNADARARPPAPRDPGALTAMSGSGRVARQLRTDRGDVNGVILDDGLIVRFPPHVGTEFARTLQPGATISAKGWGSRGAQGSAFEATAIGATTSDMREVFAGPGREPGAPRGPGAAGAARPPVAAGGPGVPRPAPQAGAVPLPASNAPAAPPAGS